MGRSKNLIYIVPVRGCSSYEAMAYLVVTAAYSAICRATYCLVTPCEWRMALVIAAI